MKGVSKPYARLKDAFDFKGLERAVLDEPDDLACQVFWRRGAGRDGDGFSVPVEGAQVLDGFRFDNGRDLGEPGDLGELLGVVAGGVAHHDEHVDFLILEGEHGFLADAGRVANLVVEAGGRVAAPDGVEQMLDVQRGHRRLVGDENRRGVQFRNVGLGFNQVHAAG